MKLNTGRKDPEIPIDADASPVKNECDKVAARHGQLADRLAREYAATGQESLDRAAQESGDLTPLSPTTGLAAV